MFTKRRISAASSASARLLLIACDPERGCHGVTGVEKLSPRKKEFDQSIKLLFVEMGGLEPPSKHRTRELSTRLVFLWFSTDDCRETGYRALIL